MLFPSGLSWETDIGYMLWIESAEDIYFFMLGFDENPGFERKLGFYESF